jgi:phosphate acyltransferase
LHLFLVGDTEQIQALLGGLSATERSRITVLATTKVVSDIARPDSILRSSRDSSMFVAIDQVRTGAADACVSAGNTGALLLAGRHLLKNIPGIIKPAIMATIPVTRAGGYSYLLDVGANIRNSAEELFQFAKMGALLASTLSGKAKARVALLNIGAEAHKGTPVIQEAAKLLGQCQDLEYTGYIEGNQLFDGLADVIVCDGFTGNIIIKTSAGAVNAMQRLMRRAISSRWYYRVFGWVLRPLLRDFRRELKPSRYNGATLVGLQGIIVKSHGNTDVSGFAQAIEHALKQINDNVPALIASKMSALDMNDIKN